MTKDDPENILDVSHLTAPDPLVQIMQKLFALKAGDKLIVRHRIEPFGLYKKLNESHFDYQTEKIADYYLITIWIKENCE